MNRARNKQRLNAWLAICAMLINMLVPSISHAVASSQGKKIPWQQICTSTGIKFSADSGTQNKGQPQQSMPMADCAMCMSHAGSDLIHVSEYTSIEFSTSHYTLPKLFYQSPRPLFIWAAASPRAPPIFS